MISFVLSSPPPRTARACFGALRAGRRREGEGGAHGDGGRTCARFGLARCRSSRAARVFGRSENSRARRRGSPDDALFAPLRSAGTAATAREARQQRLGTRGSAVNFAQSLDRRSFWRCSGCKTAQRKPSSRGRTHPSTPLTA